MEEQAASRRIIRWIATVVSFAVLASGLGILWAPEASASVLADKPFQAPQSGLSYALDSRANLWKDAWYSRDRAAQPWARESYDPSYVNPTTFPSTFATQCATPTDWGNEVNLHVPTENTYRWTVDGTVKNLRTCSSTRIPFKGQGIHDVKLQVVRPNSTVLLTKVRTVLVKDKLVVLLGDSAASGEGSPEKNRTGSQEFGTWVDRRCHRSSQAAVPRSVQEMEDADPYTTITFLNFACSGATLERNIPEEGSGVLGPYVGIEHNFAGVDPKQPSTYLPSQVDQLDNALTRRFRNQPGGGDPLRSVDKLFISGGINDLKFSKLAKVCVVFDNCPGKINSMYGEGLSVANTLKGYAAAIPASFGKLDQALDARAIVTDERYAMQYPDAFSSNFSGGICSEMLEDVLPMSSAIFVVTVLAAFLVFLHVVATGLAVIIDAVLATLSVVLYEVTGINLWGTLGAAVTGTLSWASDEIQWMNSTAMPALDKAVRDGATEGGFTFVDGIADRFEGHGYCTSDNWIVRAEQASYRQGPWNLLSRPLGFYHDWDGFHFGGLGVGINTKGLMHTTPAGYHAINQHLLATDVVRDGRTEPMFEDFKNHAPLAMGDTYTLNLNDDLSLDTGYGLGVLSNDVDVDGDELRTTLVQAPSHGTATLVGGHLGYTPTAGYTGPDSLYYRVTDGGLSSATAKITINVTKPALPDWFAWTFPTDPPSDAGGESISFPVCRNCGDLIVKTAAPLPAYGSAVLAPRPGFPGQWMLTYTAGSADSQLIVDSFDLVAGQMVNGTFQELHRATVAVEILPVLH